MAFATVIAAMVVLGTLSVAGTLRLRQSRDLEALTYELLAATSNVRGLVTDAQTATRGFAITGDESYLEPYERATTLFGTGLARLRDLTRDDPGQSRRVEALGVLIDRQAAYFRRVVDEVRTAGPAAARTFIQTGEGKRGMDAIRSLVGEIERQERAALAEHRARSEAQDRRVLFLQLALATVILATAGLAFLLVDHHLSERQRVEAELDRFFNLSLDLLAISSGDGHFKRLNPAFEQALGWSLKEMLEKPYYDFVHPDDLEATAAEVEKQVVRGEMVLHFENRYRHKNGSWRTLSWRSAPGPGGLMYASARDMTEQRRIEAMREENERHFRSLFEQIPGQYLILRPDYTIATASDAYCAATLTVREKIVGRPLFEVFPDNPDDPNADGVRNLRASLDRVRTTLKADTMAIQKYDVAGPDGNFEERYWTPSNSPLLSSDGTLAYIMHRAEDVTEFVRQGHRKTEEIEGGDARRMEQLEAEIFASSQALKVANDRLREANAEMESFSYSVSHDLRAPLRHVQGYVQMLLRETDGRLSAKATRYLGVIRDASRDMGVLIDDLLSFSRMTRATMQTAAVNLDEVVARVLQDLEPDWRDRHVEWKVGTLGVVTGDASMLRQVFVNLLGNALKYSRPRDPAVIEVSASRDASGEFTCSVRDNGVGFDPKYVDKLFGVFQRLHRADEFEGAGIGLANVRRIIGRHGGRVWAEGRLNEGAAFHFTLPAPPATIPGGTNHA